MAVPGWIELLVGAASGSATAVLLVVHTLRSGAAYRPALVVVAVLLVAEAVLGGVVVLTAVQRLFLH
jgi:hypothetical protein